jgi:probable HAF family extracellular repeat protein
LGTLGGQQSYGVATNVNGHIVGSSAIPGDFVYHAVMWTVGSPRDLGTMGGDTASGTGINKFDQVVGYSTLAGSSDLHAALWDDGWFDLGSLGGTLSYAFAINDTQAVGMSMAKDNNLHAFVFANNLMEDLNSLIADGTGWLLMGARAINDVGQIAGFGTYNGQTHAFLLTPLN